MWFMFHHLLGAATLLAAGSGSTPPSSTTDLTGGTTLLAWLNLIAIVVGPVVAVLISVILQRWWEQRKETHDAKLKLFLTLMADRKSSPATYEWVRALNLIDVVFEDNKGITDLWHSLYELMNNPSAEDTRADKLVELLSEMAEVLGFKNLKQVNIGKFHCPKVHIDQLKAQEETQAELLRVLKNTSQVKTEPMEGPK